MGQALYRKYRSKSLSEIVGQEHITTALKNALDKGNISHAYLFTGPRGIGKTSIARILAHEVNGLTYSSDSTHLDIIEIDAASNRRIDEIRELRERVHSAPTSVKYKVYIIDEVHMLTKEAFNALLKTLEEPPAHVIFILATTESHKLPETIISRTQRYTFKPIDTERAVKHLEFIAKSEGIRVSHDALELIAEHGQGSFRDSISLLDQVSNSADTIGLDEVRNMLGIAPTGAITELITNLEASSVSATLKTLQQLRLQGFSAATTAKQLATRLRQDLLESSTNLSQAALLGLLERLLAVQASHDPETALELALLTGVTDATQPHQQTAVPETPTPPVAKKVSEKPKIEPSVTPKKLAEDIIAAKPSTVEAPAFEITDENNLWQETLQEIKKTHNTLYSVARMAVATTDGDEITLQFSFPFHHKRISESKNKQVITDVIQRLSGRAVTLVCVLGGKQSVVKKASAKTHNPLDNISNIFGSAEVLE